MPITSPFMLRSGPPELPGVHRDVGLDERDRVEVRVRPRFSRLFALTMPAVTGVREAEGRSDRDHPFAHAKLRGVADLHDGKAGRLDLEHRDVAAHVGADDFRLELALVGEADRDLLRVLDHVRVGHDEAVLGDDEPGAQAEGRSGERGAASLAASLARRGRAARVALLVRRHEAAEEFVEGSSSDRPGTAAVGVRRAWVLMFTTAGPNFSTRSAKSGRSGPKLPGRLRRACRGGSASPKASSAPRRDTWIRFINRVPCWA
jgi:hypothetical protein